MCAAVLYAALALRLSGAPDLRYLIDLADLLLFRGPLRERPAHRLCVRYTGLAPTPRPAPPNTFRGGLRERDGRCETRRRRTTQGMSQQVSRPCPAVLLLLVVPPQLTSARPVAAHARPPPPRTYPIYSSALLTFTGYFHSDVPPRRRKSSLLSREPRPTHRALVMRPSGTADTLLRTIHALLGAGAVWVTMGVSVHGFLRADAAVHDRHQGAQ
ncbi:hypothetical protein B0H15DRAFT_59483 [Mycena belliarum]|uniref:Uncharacterized protein n=1 Tax=Mycena belliarum TaxID=1033014 RepID=A0AAD6XIV0_9AGAR|nr:hypothetical protein B0H15DRAFT_59483 [Mycena belliae]